MAFGGVAVVNQISDRVVRITGLTLANAATGTIALSNGPASDVNLPATFTPQEIPSVAGDPSVVDTITDRTRVSIQQTAAAATGQPYHVQKNGVGQTTFQIAITNDGAAGSGALEIYVEILG